MAGCVARVRSSAVTVSHVAENARINSEGVEKVSAALSIRDFKEITSPKAFDSAIHFIDKGPLTAQYLLVLDALNFCFWPDEELEYEDLALGLKASVERDKTVISAERLADIDEQGVQTLLDLGRPIPLQSERARLLREVGTTLRRLYKGQASNLVSSGNQSADQLVSLLVSSFPGFQDHAIYRQSLLSRGCQVFLYKRAQIFVGDIWGAFEGTGLGTFHDIDELTMFADYRVPVVLREMGILQYSDRLATKVLRQALLEPGSEEEIEIRACTIAAVEQLKDAINRRFHIYKIGSVNSIQLDWWLWDQGEKQRKAHPPHHRTLTIFY